MKFCGIYKVTNKVNGFSYIGQAVEILVRWRQHLTEAFNPLSVGYDSYFYRAIRKYGIESFDFSILETCDVSMLDEREIYYVSKFNTYLGEGYNMTAGGQRDISCTTARAIDQYDVDGNFIASYISIAEAMRATGARHISRVLCGDSRTAGGYYWSYHGDGFNMRDVGSHSSPVCQYTLSGEFVQKYASIKDAMDETKITGISYACRNKTKAGNWLWAYEGDEIEPYKYPKYNHPLNKTVNQFTNDGDFVASYMSFAEASRKTGIAQSGISSCCRGKYKQSGGYIWKCANQPDVTG